jgi:hypothetical protein
VEERRLSVRFGRGARAPPARPAYWGGGVSPSVLVAGPATLQQGTRGGAEALRPFWSRGPRPSSKASILGGRRLSARFGRGARDPPARHARGGAESRRPFWSRGPRPSSKSRTWRGGGTPPVLVAGPATLQQCKKPAVWFLRLMRFIAASFGMLDAGCWMLDAGRWMLDAGCWMVNGGRRAGWWDFRGRVRERGRGGVDRIEGGGLVVEDVGKNLVPGVGPAMGDIVPPFICPGITGEVVMDIADACHDLSAGIENRFFGFA